MLHPRRPRSSQSGRVKRRDESFQAWVEEPLGTDSQRTISKRSSDCRLLIGHKKCFVLLCPIKANSILGDPGGVSRDGRKGGTKGFKYGRKSPWVPTLTRPFPKIQADASSWLGTKNALYYCAQSANSISWVLFVSSYMTAIDSITACLVHAPKKCTQSGNFQFDIKSPSDFKILSTRKLKTLFQKYKLELTTGIHACIGHVLRKY